MTGRRIQDLARQYAPQDYERLAEALEQRLAAEPACPVARYLLACWCIDHGQPATAVRHLMTAHHAEPQFQSAALLAFAGLNWVSRRNAPLLPVLLETWEEFRRPAFDQLPRERALLDAFAAPDPGLAQLPSLAGRLWRLPIHVLRGQIRAAVLSRDAGLYPLLATPA